MEKKEMSENRKGIRGMSRESREELGKCEW